MQEFRKILSSLNELDENRLRGLIKDGQSPDVILAALLSIFDGYRGIPDCHWLYDFSGEAFDSVFTLVAEASDEDIDEVKAMLYRSVIQHASKKIDEIYEGYEDTLPDWKPVPTKWPWPVVVSADRTWTSSSPTIDFGHQFSALKMFGYTVGKTKGWSQKKRRSFLSDFMEKDLPEDVVECFANEYGSPMSTTRLRKVANTIASNCGLRLKDDPTKYRYAIDDWSDDLEFLKSTYYEGKGLKFLPWPDPRD